MMYWQKYVLETHWAFDHRHSEFCTFAFERNGDFAKLFDPNSDASEDLQVNLMRMIREVCNAQNGNFMAPDNCKPIAIYKVVGPNRPYRTTGLPEMHMEAPPLKVLTFHLELIGKFDSEGLPILNTKKDGGLPEVGDPDKLPYCL